MAINPLATDRKFFQDAMWNYSAFAIMALTGVILNFFIAWKMGFKIIEIPIVFTDRTVGESKMNRSIVIEAIWIIHKLLINNIFNKF